MTELDVINNMLGTLGEAPLNQMDEDHPFVAAGRRFLDTANRRLQARGWWFNKELLKFVPDASSSFVYVPVDILSVRESNVRRCRFRYIQRDDRLYDLSNSTYEIAENPVYLDVVRLVPFDDVDHLAKNAIALQAVLQFQQYYDADPQKTSNLKEEFADVWMTLNAEHTRQVKANFIYSNSVGGKLALVSLAGGWGRLPYPGMGVR